MTSESYEELEKEFTEREFSEIKFAQVYDNEFSHGTDGHNRLLLIAKLYRLLKKFYSKTQ